MDKKKIFLLLGIIFILICLFIIFKIIKKEQGINSSEIMVSILAVNNDEIIVQDSGNIIYTFNNKEISAEIGDNIIIEYTGILDKNKSIQDVSIVDYSIYPVSIDDNGIPTDWLDNGIFSKYYILANNKLKELTLEEKIGQLLLVRFPDDDAINILKNYKLGGYLFFEKDFKDKTKEDVKNLMFQLQNNSNIPILTAVDEEGGKVVRISSNPNLVDEKFKSSKELYNIGGFSEIKQDTIEKSEILKNLGINLNLAPVVDVSSNPNDYIYERSFGESTVLTSTYAKTVIEASKNTGVSYTLKHFPGYGNNLDTHISSSTDTRTYDDILANDIPPFQAGIDSGAEAVLVSHNIVNSIDSNNPASLSTDVHNLLRNELGFTGIIITDDLSMGAVSSIDDIAVKAILAGNDLIITTDYEQSIKSIKQAIVNNVISEELIDKLAFRVLAWKYYKGLMLEYNK